MTQDNNQERPFSSPMQLRPDIKVSSRMALMIHQAEARGFGQHRLDRAVYVSAHEVEEGEGGARLQPGRFLSATDMAMLGDILRNENLDAYEEQVVSYPILSMGSGVATWVVPGGVRTMYLKVGKRLLKPKVPWPNLIYRVVQNKLYLAAYKGNAIPTMDTPLFHAPLMNVYRGSEVCQGDVEFPPHAALHNLKDWVAGIEGSAFVHTNHDHVIKVKGSSEAKTEQVMQFWRDLRGKKSFPNTVLTPMKETVQRWIERTAT